MKIFILSIISVSFLLACSSGIEGEGAATDKREYAVDQFSKVEIDCNCDVTFIPSEAGKVAVESHQNLLDNYEINSNGKTLTIKEKETVSKYSLNNVNIYIDSNFKEIELNGQAKMKTAGTLKSPKFSLTVNDQSTVNECYMDITDFDLDLADQTQTTIGGTVITLNLDATEEAKAFLTEFQAVEIDFDANDNTLLNLYAMKDLNGKASDNAQVFYKGDPNKDTVEKDRALITKK